MKIIKKLLYILILLFVIIFSFLEIKNYRTDRVQKVKKQKNNEPEYNKEYIKNINTISLKNSEIENKYQFVYISDLHLSVTNNEEKDEKIKQSLYDRNKSFYGDEDSTIAKNTFSEIIKYTNNKNADALLLGGDIIDAPADSSIEVLRENLNNLKVDYLYTLGNHDWSFAWDYHTPNARNEQVPKFKEFMNDTDVSYLEYEDLIILAINSSTDQIEEQSLDKIKNVLEKNKPTIVMMHVPISTPKIAEDSLKLRDRVSAVGEGGIEPTETTKEAIQMILSNKYKVFYVLGAHVHIHMEADLNEKIHEYVTDAAHNGTINVVKVN